MTLALTLVLSALTLAALFWGLGLFVQPYLYSEPAEYMPLRALAGGLVVGGFLTGWVYVNTRADTPDKYGTLFEFTPVAVRDVPAFETVRRLNQKAADGSAVEKTVAYKRAGGRGGEFVEAADPTRKLLLNGSTNGVAFMTVALLVPEPAGDAKGRFDAELDKSGERYRATTKMFRDDRGRFIEGDQPGRVFAPSRWAVIGALVLNALHFAVWFVVFWQVLHYTSGHALGLAGGFGAFAVFVAVPLLFQTNRPKVPAAVMVSAERVDPLRNSS